MNRILYINDFDDTVNNFADDTKIYHRYDSVQGSESMRVNFHNLVLWSKECQMLLNLNST